MKQVKGDLWDFHEKGATVVVPTNKFVSPRGRAVMGRGVAKQAASKFPGLENRYARSLKQGHDLVHYQDLRLLMFPVKPETKDGKPGFMAKADLEMIRENVKRLERWQGGEVYLPAVGCGFGELKFDDVLPVLENLSDQFTLVLRDESVNSKYPESFRPGTRQDQGLRKELPTPEPPTDEEIIAVGHAVMDRDWQVVPEKYWPRWNVDFTSILGLMRARIDLGDRIITVIESNPKKVTDPKNKAMVYIEGPDFKRVGQVRRGNGRFWLHWFDK